MLDGFTHEELMLIGTRKAQGEALPMSATDINAAIPYVVSQQAMATISGSDENTLKHVSERRMDGLPINPAQLNELNLPYNGSIGQTIGPQLEQMMSNVLNPAKRRLR